MAFMLTLLLGATAATASAQTATWLDSTPRSWNTPGMASPPQAPPMQNSDPRCRTRQDAPATPEERQVAGMGWKLEAYWPAIRSGSLVLVTALADYDGMCRPLQFNVFVFAAGAYAGTLSPVNMNSRTDGVLTTPNGKSGLAVQSDGTIQAVFTRYASADPLCCPSLGTTTVTYRVQTLHGSPVALPVSISGAAPATTAGQPMQVPLQMPATGGGGGAPP